MNTDIRRRKGRRPGIALIITAVAGLISGCGDSPQDLQAGTLGTNVDAGPILLRNVYVDVEPRPDGDQATVRFTVFNEASHPEELTGVASSHAKRFVMHWDRACDGTAEEVGRLPLLSRGRVPGADTTDTGSPYYVTMTDLTRPIREGTTVPVTFSFAKAGEIQVDALVVNETQRVEIPSKGCREESGPTAGRAEW
ncbi:copper chaperone PCu(A)C [Amycolatopsis keratiniphila]|uniref:copper chaperone PCu(A)C n=1 Tax=Amycolatopsis keratiniphila TaxID=129921 RepID=UPI000879F3FD|nr:copper chaperone PCu(A)C [Amycolatopsis keratiniphila]OLZ58098.1 hypothetical protein BS330_12750 [Amycolatopsis keratiniphila subsp. nogabecina]SDU44051.1 Copper(I)-binding protein [Amycolatopsis keratiniphila]